MEMPQRNARTRLVNIPKEFLPQIEEETERLVFFSQVHTMGVILSQYFNRNQLTWSKFCQEAEIKPDSPIARSIKKALAKRLTFAAEEPGQKTPEHMVEVKES
jgi:hypothetical protein